MKRAGHLLSKMRFVSSQLNAYLTKDVWLKNARHANLMAEKLSGGLKTFSDIQVIYPTEGNEVFVKFPNNVINKLNDQGYKFSKEEFSEKSIRLVTAWNTKEEDVNHLLNIIKDNN